MNQPEAGEASEAAHGHLDSQKELAEVLRQRAAVSAVLRAIANSPNDLQPIFDTIIDSAVHLCRAEWGAFRLVEEIGFRLVAYKVNLALSAVWSPPMLRGHDSFIGRLLGSKSPVHIPDLATHLERNSAVGEADREAISRGVRTFLIVPMLRNDELIGTLSLVRYRIEPFTEKEIELVTDFAAQTAIALEITRRERQYRQLQMELAHANRVATIGQLTASIVHELKQPIAAARAHGSAGLRWLDKTPPDLAEARHSLVRIVKATDRARDVVDRIRSLIRNAPPRNEVLDLNDAILEVSALTHSEAIEAGVTVRTQLAPCLPHIHGDRVQLQQVMLNLIVNAIQAMSGVTEDRRDLLISSEATDEGACVGVRDTGPGLHPESLPRLFEPFYTTKPDGMGMGLSICRSIIEAHGGRLWATGLASQGALFQFAIPARPA
jgi:C4-dicarboxylate-specific signal transduction histidine kinase